MILHGSCFGAVCGTGFQPVETAPLSGRRELLWIDSSTFGPDRGDPLVMAQELGNYYRFCPDQPKMLISDAVCQGRRRVHYSWCAGCRFNDDEKAEKGERKTGANSADAAPPGDPPPNEAKEPMGIQIEIDTNSADDAKPATRCDGPAKDV